MDNINFNFPNNSNNFVNDETVSEIKKLFHTLDLDNDNFLSHEEIGRVMTRLNGGSPPTSQEVHACFVGMDADGDSRVDENEFVTAILRWLQVKNSSSALSSAPTSPRPTVANNRLEAKSRVLSDVVDFFQQFKAIPDYQEEQNRILSRDRSELNCESLRFGYETIDSSVKSSHLEKVREVISAGQATLQQKVWARSFDVVSEGLSQVRLLLEMDRVFSSPAEKLEHAPTLYAIWSALTGADQSLPLVGVVGSVYEGQQLPAIIDRLVELSSVAPSLQMQTEAVECLHLYTLGPRVPAIAQNNIWHFSCHYSQQVVFSRGLLPRLLEILRAHSLATRENQFLLTACLNTFAALVDALPELRIQVATQLVREGVSVRQAIVSYLQQFSLAHSSREEEKEDRLVFNVDLVRATASALAIFCGHSSFQVTDDDVPAPSAPLLPSIEELSNIVQTVHESIDRVISTNSQVKGDEATLTHLATIFGLTLPLIPLPLLQQQCAPLLEQLFLLMTKNWSSVLSAKVAVCRINHCLVDLIHGDESAARWLFSSIELRKSLKAQAEAGRAHLFCNIGVSALLVLEECLAAGLEAEVSEAFFECLAALLHVNTLRPWAMSCLLCLFRPKPYFFSLLSRGLVESYLFGIIKLRVHGSIFDSYSQMLEIESTYNTSQVLSIVITLNEIIELNFDSLQFNQETLTSIGISSDVEYKKLLVGMFTMESVDAICMLRDIMCEDIEEGRLLETEPDILPLVQELPRLLLNVKQLHAFCQTPVSYNISLRIDGIIHSWQQKFGQCAKNAVVIKRHRSLSFSSTVAGGDMQVEGNENLEARQLPYLRLVPGSRLLHLLVKPQWHVLDLNGVPLREKDRLFVIPAIVDIDLLLKSLSGFFSRLVRILYTPLDSNDVVLINTQLQFQQMIQEAEKSFVLVSTSNVDTSARLPRICIQIQPALPGEITFQNATHALQSRDSALRQVQQVAQGLGIALNASVMDEVYSFFQQQRLARAEIDVEQFVVFMRERMNVAEQAARPLFRIFDSDNSGTLSLSEIGIGLALLVQGSADDRIIAAFNAYDADRSGTLDFEELQSMVSVVLGVPRDPAGLYATSAYRFLGLSVDQHLSLEQFVILVKARQLPLEQLLPDISQPYNHTGNFNSFLSNSNFNKGLSPIQQPTYFPPVNPFNRVNTSVGVQREVPVYIHSRSRSLNKSNSRSNLPVLDFNPFRLGSNSPMVSNSRGDMAPRYNSSPLKTGSLDEWNRKRSGSQDVSGSVKRSSVLEQSLGLSPRVPKNF